MRRHCFLNHLRAVDLSLRCKRWSVAAIPDQSPAIMIVILSLSEEVPRFHEKLDIALSMTQNSAPILLVPVSFTLHIFGFATSASKLAALRQKDI